MIFLIRLSLNRQHFFSNRKNSSNVQLLFFLTMKKLTGTKDKLELSKKMKVIN